MSLVTSESLKLLRRYKNNDNAVAQASITVTRSDNIEREIQETL